MLHKIQSLNLDQIFSGMAAKCTRLEKELEERSVDKLEGGEEEEGAGSGQVRSL